MGSFNTALSGMNAAQRALDVYGNNIANSTTVGFKSSFVSFADVMANSGSNAAGSGVTSYVQQGFGTSTITPSSNVLDMAINGSGFFIQSNNGAISYTRNGQFKLDDKGGIINSNTGFALVGKRVDGSQGPLSISTQNLAPSKTTQLTVGLNLNSSTVGVDPVATQWVASPDGEAPSSKSYTYKTSTTFYDSLGNSHVLDMYYIRANPSAANPSENYGSENSWYFAAKVDGKDISIPASPTNNNADNLYSITFNGDGSFKSTSQPGGAATATAGKIPITIPSSFLNGAAGDGGAGTPMTVNVDFTSTTQFGSPFAVQSLEDNGHSTGSLQGLSIDTKGNIFGTFSNGLNSLLGSVLLATFPDPGKLQIMGQNGWIETNASGKPLVSEGNTGATGAIQSGATEDSATDLTGSLVMLNKAQSYFQANSRVISVNNQMIQTILQSVS
ncbi:flagellar hook protein FlgE [Legionella sp. km772]|uniref:flagellar hook protein FlgE n=1 Tax=Legionella sp. km772 TaxID=2498111 RepID=UPI000F8CFAEC|nr:flagellar hook protein FlgE [Legionella sp. km772]RUR08869.1 flagellar hook protein FlgE [Legionella sp. km772]